MAKLPDGYWSVLRGSRREGWGFEAGITPLDVKTSSPAGAYRSEREAQSAARKASRQLARDAPGEKRYNGDVPRQGPEA